jgi:sensor histidine kinase YesM
MRRLRFVVDARPEGEPRAGSGLGLGNVRDRLQAHFGERGRLKAERRSEHGYRAEIELPLAVPA